MFFIFLNSEKFILSNYGKPLKYIFQTHYKFEKNKKLVLSFSNRKILHLIMKFPLFFFFPEN
jgi:hypothetical protein